MIAEERQSRDVMGSIGEMSSGSRGEERKGRREED